MASQTFIPASFSSTIWKIYRKKPWTRGGSSFFPTASPDMFKVYVHRVPWSVTALKQRVSAHLTGAAVTLTLWKPCPSQSTAGSRVWVPRDLHTPTLILSSKVLPPHHSSPGYPTHLWRAQDFITHWKGLCPHSPHCPAKVSGAKKHNNLVSLWTKKGGGKTGDTCSS